VRYILKEVLKDVGETDRKAVVDARDIDQWTPLLWALRACPFWQPESAERKLIVKELLDNGADLFAEGLGLDRKWTALKLARHHGLDQDMIEYIETAGGSMDAATSRQKWDLSSRNARRAKSYGLGYCDACFNLVVGVYYECSECGIFCLCFKCYRSKSTVHYGHHVFTDQGYEYDDNSSFNLGSDAVEEVEIEHEDQAAPGAVEGRTTDDAGGSSQAA